MYIHMTKAIYFAKQKKNKNKNKNLSNESLKSEQSRIKTWKANSKLNYCKINSYTTQLEWKHIRTYHRATFWINNNDHFVDFNIDKSKCDSSIHTTIYCCHYIVVYIVYILIYLVRANCFSSISASELLYRCLMERVITKDVGHPIHI